MNIVDNDEEGGRQHTATVGCQLKSRIIPGVHTDRSLQEVEVISCT